MNKFKNRWQYDLILERHYPKTAAIMWIAVIAVIIGCYSVSIRETPLPAVNGPYDRYDCPYCHFQED